MAHLPTLTAAAISSKSNQARPGRLLQSLPTTASLPTPPINSAKKNPSNPAQHSAVIQTPYNHSQSGYSYQIIVHTSKQNNRPGTIEPQPIKQSRSKKNPPFIHRDDTMHGKTKSSLSGRERKNANVFLRSVRRRHRTSTRNGE